MFVLINLWFVVPHFSDWGRVQTTMAKAQKKLEDYNKAIADTPKLQVEVAKLEGESMQVPQEEQATHFASTIQVQVIQSGFSPETTGKIEATTNQTFLN